MNKININRIDTYGASANKVPTAVMKAFRDTLRFCAENICNNWYSPDDMYFNMNIHGMLSHPISVIIKLQPMKAKTKRPYGPELSIDLTYASDIQLSDCMASDVLTTLRHYGLSALYNGTNKDIIIKAERI